MANLITTDPFEDFFRGFFVRPVELGANGDMPSIRIDVKEAADRYTVHAEIPGVKKENIHVHVDNGVVSITAERQHRDEVKEGEKLLRTERSYGKISRSFQLAGEIDETTAQAKYQDGVLELVLPKRATPRARHLTIQ